VPLAIFKTTAFAVGFIATQRTNNGRRKKHLYENHFHNQLKAKLLECEAVTQIVRQTMIAPNEFLNARGKPLRRGNWD
jgi:hypothetical protein